MQDMVKRQKERQFEELRRQYPGFYTLERMDAGCRYEQLMLVRLMPVLNVRLFGHYVVMLELVAAWQPRS
jgi:hypothetical protein